MARSRGNRGERGPATGLVSTARGGGAVRGRASHESSRFLPGSVMRPSRSSRSISPRQTMSLGVPLACVQPQRRQSSFERKYLLAPGFRSINSLISSTSCSLYILPRYRISTPMLTMMYHRQGLNASVISGLGGRLRLYNFPIISLDIPDFIW